jgi:hypothetical protein
MRNKLGVMAGGLILTAALASTTATQASVSHTGFARANAGPAVSAGLKQEGCGSLWSEGPDSNGADGQYAYVYADGTGPNPELTNYPANAAYFAPLADFGGLGAPDFCNVSVTTINGAFEIRDPNDPNSADTEWGCLAVDTQNNLVVDDTPSACTQQDYSWDQWYAINTGATYHSQTLWEFESRNLKLSGYSYCLTADGYSSSLYPSPPANVEPCGDYPDYQEFVWDSNL